MADGDGPGPGGQETPEQLRARMDAALRDEMTAALAEPDEPPKKAVSPYAARMAAQGKPLVPPEQPPTFGERLSSGFETGARHILNTAQGLPGMTALEAGAGALGSKFTDHPMSYRESYDTLQGETAKIPAALRIIEQMAGGAALMPVLPPAAAGASTLAKIGRAGAEGAGIGAADALASGDPNAGFMDRLKQAGVNAAVGAAAAPVLHGVMSGVKSAGKTIKGVTKATLPEALGGAPSLGKQVQQMDAERAAVGELYEKSLANAGKPTPKLQAFLQEPDAAKQIGKLRELDKWKGVPADDPHLIDALYQSWSDTVGQLENQLAPVDPALANIRRQKMADIRGKQKRLLELLQTPEMTAPRVEVTPPRRVMGPNGEPRDVLTDESVTGHIMEGTAGRARGDLSQVGLDESGAVGRASPRDVQGPAGPGFMLRGRVPEVREVVPARTLPAMMADYPAAVQGAAARAGEREAHDLGLKAMAAAAKGGARTTQELADVSPEAIQAWVNKATTTATQRQKALAAVLGSAAKETGRTLHTPGGYLLGGLGAYAGGPIGATLGAGLRMMPAAARAHALREILDPTNPLAQRTFSQVLAALNAPLASK